MKIWITGGAGSGKSSLAQDLAAALAAGGPRYYVATMVPRDEEDHRRIRRHIEDRAGMGFQTIECPCRLMERIDPDPDGTYLLDSATALLSNAMFGEREFAYDPDAAARAAEDLQRFSCGVKNLIAVSDGIYSDAARYDEMTENYRCGLASVERQMAAVSDTVIECAAGGVLLQKGTLPAGFQLTIPGDVQMEHLQLIIGGAFQGKKEYAMTHYNIKETEICTCTEDGAPNMNVRCIDHLERYLRGCALKGVEPIPPFFFREDAVLICEDITCGVVPISAEDRKWREMTGRYLQELVRDGAEVTRVFCGFPQKLGRVEKVHAVERIPEETDCTCQILLLRHGRTKANEEHLYCGSTDWPLSEEGRTSLSEKAGIYGSDWDFFYTSGMSRAKETLSALFGEQKAVIEEPDFREMDFGAFEGKSYAMLKDDPAYQEWISGDNEKNICPGGESGEQMRERVLCAFDWILRNDPEESIVIVTHGGPIAAIMQKLFPEQGLNRYQWQPECGDGYLLKITGSSLNTCRAEYEKCPQRGE